MDKVEKAKLKVLIKMILIHNSPEYMTAKQICEIINNYNFGFRSTITPVKVGKLLNVELKKGCLHFLDDINMKEYGNFKTYKYGGD